MADARSPRIPHARAARRTAALALAALAVLAFAACDEPETAVMRGDRLWADSQYTAALAEYRLAVRRGGADDGELLRAAHAFARENEFDLMRSAYDELVVLAPEYTDQAVYDYIDVARRALERGDRYDMTRAVEAALELRPELSVPGLNEQMARYYRETGDTERALAFYRRALAHTPPDSAAAFLYTIGLLYESTDDCERAIEFYGAYRAQVPSGQRDGEAAWHMGNCAFRLARTSHQRGFLTEATSHLDTVLELGVPENVQDEAWFRRGDILYALGRFDESLEAFRMVLELNPQRTGRLVERAQERIDQIRFR